MTPEEIENYVELVETDFHDLSIHGFFPLLVITTPAGGLFMVFSPRILLYHG